MNSEMVQALIAFVVGGGLLTFITQLVRAWGSFRRGARASTREVIRDLAAARDESEDREADVRRDRDYWRGIAADYGWQLRSCGRTPVPENPMSPSEARREAERGTGNRRSLRQKRAERAPTTEEIESADDA